MSPSSSPATAKLGRGSSTRRPMRSASRYCGRSASPRSLPPRVKASSLTRSNRLVPRCECPWRIGTVMVAAVGSAGAAGAAGAGSAAGVASARAGWAARRWSAGLASVAGRTCGRANGLVGRPPWGRWAWKRNTGAGSRCGSGARS